MDISSRLSTSALAPQFQAAGDASGRAAADRRTRAAEQSRNRSGGTERAAEAAALGAALKRPAEALFPDGSATVPGAERTTAARLLGLLINQMGGAANSTAKGTFVDLLV